MCHDNQLQSDDESDDERLKNASLVSLVAFRAHTQEIEQVCREWLSGEVCDEIFLSRFEADFQKRFTIQEISSPDDHFDWSIVPADIMEACDDALSRHKNAWRLLHAIRETIGELQSIGEWQDDPIVRVAILGEYLEKFSFSHKRFSQFQSQHPASGPPEPPAPMT